MPIDTFFVFFVFFLVFLYNRRIFCFFFVVFYASHLPCGAATCPPPRIPSSVFVFKTLQMLFCCAPFGLHTLRAIRECR